ncbi:MAG: response regulator [bacterium]|nr:response regulator [bacterium]
MEKEKAKPAQRILIIDDDAFLLDMYALKFSQKNFDVTTSGGTLDALEKLHAGYKPDILLVDLVMPTMDGFQFLEQMKKEKLAESALILVLSNLSQEEDVAKSLKLGASGHIVKASATPSEVVERVLAEMRKQKK